MTVQYSVRVPDDATSLERQFLEALQRIMRGDATHPTLRAKASQGRFRPSVSSVALEAGRDRKPIATGGLPRVASEIARAQRRYKASTLPDDVLDDVARIEAEKTLKRRLREAGARITEFKRDRDAAYTSEAGAMMLARALEKYMRRSDLDVQSMRRAAESSLSDT